METVFYMFGFLIVMGPLNLGLVSAVMGSVVLTRPLHVVTRNILKTSLVLSVMPHLMMVVRSWIELLKERAIFRSLAHLLRRWRPVFLPPVVSH